MARYTGPRTRISRRFGTPIFGPSKYLERRNYGPGMHGPKSRRKFTDYALPAGSYSMPLSVVQSTGGRVGWHQSPLPGPFDLPSRYNPYGW